MHMRRISSTLVVAVASALACGDLGFEASVQGKAAFDPPDSYPVWWAATEACTSVEGNYDAVSWFLADGIVGDGAVARGRWSPPHDIVIVRGYENDDKTVKHEMFHDLLNGDPTHEAPEWGTCDLLFR